MGYHNTSGLGYANIPSFRDAMAGSTLEFQRSAKPEPSSSWDWNKFGDNFANVLTTAAGVYNATRQSRPSAPPRGATMPAANYGPSYGPPAPMPVQSSGINQQTLLIGALAIGALLLLSR